MGFTILESSSREEWLEQRKGYLTATDIASIRTGTEKAFRELWEKKHKGDTFRGNRYTDWGLEREPAIAEYVRDTLGYRGLHPNSKLVVKDGTRHAATPDMMAEDGSMSCQIKTVGEASDWSDVRHLPAQYRAQVEWEMHVLGIEKCLFAWEIRHDTEDGFEPGDIYDGVVKSDPKLRKKLLEIAAEFEAYEPDEIQEGGDDFTIRALIQHLSEAMEERREIQARDKEIKATIAEIQSELLSEVGEDPRRIRFPEGVLEVTAGKVLQRFDRKALAAEFPDIEQKFLVETVGRPTISFKAVS